MAVGFHDFDFAAYRLADGALTGYQNLFGGSNSAMSIACWWRCTATPADWSGLFGSTNNGSWSNGCGVFFYGGAIRGWVGDYSATQVIGPSVTLRRWQHVCLTYDGSTVRLYTDGVSRGTPTSLTGSVTHGQLNIGNFPSSPAVRGMVDTVGVWNAALSADQVRALYQSPTVYAGLPASVRGPSLAHWWDTDVQRQILPARGSSMLYAVSPGSWLGPQPAGFVRRGGVMPGQYASMATLAQPAASVAARLISRPRAIGGGLF